MSNDDRERMPDPDDDLPPSLTPADVLGPERPPQRCKPPSDCPASVVSLNA